MGIVRYFTVLLLASLVLLRAERANALVPRYVESEQSSLSTATDWEEDEEMQVDDTVLEMLLEEPKLCCPANLPPRPPNNTLAGLLFWSRIKILCQNLRPTAIC